MDDVVDELGSRREVEYAFEIMRGGTSADRQLATYEQTGDLRAVVDRIVSETAEGVRPDIVARVRLAPGHGRRLSCHPAGRDPAGADPRSDVASWLRPQHPGPVIGIPTQTLQSLGGVSARFPPRG